MKTKLLNAVALCLICVGASQAQPLQPALQLTDAQVKAQYQNCPNGYYSGPRPGKTRYTKDKWVWAVTPEFAKNFCMPPEFVSTELKGAHAVAYKMVKDEDEEICGWGGNAEVCGSRTEHRFEIYYANGAIPKEREVPYFHAAKAPSRMLITLSEAAFDITWKSTKTKPRTGALGPFESQAFGLEAVAENKIAWPLGALSPEIYYEESFQGIDYLAVEGASGFSRQEGWIKSGSRKFVISVNKLKDNRRSYQKPLSEHALVIELPQSMTDQIIANDQSRGINLKAMAQQAMSPKPAASR